MDTKTSVATVAIGLSLEGILVAIERRTNRRPGSTTLTLKYHLTKSIKDALVAEGFKVENKSRTKTEFDGTTKVLGKKTVISW